MVKFPEAKIALCKCKESKKIYGVRFERFQNAWKYTWAFPIKEQSAKRENYDNTNLIGDLIKDNDYPGCPYCRASYFVICSQCGKLNCNNMLSGMFKCGWCGASGMLTSYDGSGVKSGSDR